MLSVTITEKDGPSSVQTFDSTKSEVLIGRIKGNDIVLGRSNISKRHSRIVVKDGKIIVIDLKSTNGTFVNGEKITGPRVIEEGDKIFIGDFTIEVRETGGGAAVGSSVGAPSMQPFPSGPSAASLPSIGGVDPQHMAGPTIGGPRAGGVRPSMPGMASTAGVPGPMGPGLSSPMDMASPMGMGPGAAPSLGGPMGPGAAPSLGGPMGPGAGPMGPGAAPSLGSPMGLGAGPMGPGAAPSLGGPMGPGAGPMGLGAAPSLGGPMGPGAAPSLGAPMGPGVSPSLAGPSNSMEQSSAPMGPGVAPSLGASPAISAPKGPNLGVSSAPMGGADHAPNLGASMSQIGGPSASLVSSPLGASQLGVSGSRSMSNLSSVKQPSNIGAPASEGIMDKSLRGASKSVAGTRGVQSARNVGTAALPEEIVVDDARTPESDAWIKAARVVMDKYLSMNDFQTIASMPYPPEPETQDSCYNQLMECINSCRSQLGSVNPDSLVDFLLKEACGLGAVDSLIDDTEVSAFNVYNFETIVVERKGHREISSLQFTSADTLYLVAQRLLQFNGLTPQNAPAVSEVRFGDGTQIEVVIPPVSVASTSIVVRKPNHEYRALHVLSQHGMLSHEMEEFLNLCVKARRNILIVGAQTSGRTTLLNALGAEIPDGERIVTVENSAVLVMPQLYVMSLEAQNATFGQGGDLGSLIRQAGRLRAERVLADSLQTASDATAFVSSVCSGAQGSIATAYGLNASEGFAQFKRMVGTDPNVASLVGNIDIVVNVRAFTDAKRRIVEIAEVVEQNGEYQLVPIFIWSGSGMGNMAVGDGQFKALGNIPNFYRELERGGMALDPSIFNP